ncbi:MAG: hypothetical protein SF162_01380 [bacterium]|nr:hypothetical protein [bacterium]
MHGKHHWNGMNMSGWGQGWQGRGGWGNHHAMNKGWWFFPLFLMFLFFGGWRWLWVLFFVVPFFMWFVMPMIARISRERGYGEWWNGSADRSSDDGEKRKRDEFISYHADSEKPKRSPVYIVGDDGEMVEVPNDDTQGSPRRKNDDGIEYI